ISAVEGMAFSGAVATFTDPAGPEAVADYTATIDWGNGSSPGTITVSGNTFTVTGSHTYAEEGSYTINVMLTHDSGAATTVMDTTTVSDPAVVATGGFMVTAVEGAGSAPQTVATFTDPGGAEPNASDPIGTVNDHYGAAIDWGDGT